MSLFFNRYYRNLVAYALHSYWQESKNNLLNLKNLTAFDGKEETKSILDVLREKLAYYGIPEESRDSLRKLIQYISLLYKFEKDINHSENSPHPAEFYREKAFHILDWIPAFSGKAGAHIIINMLLQAGLNFQKPQAEEKTPPVRMADQQLALKIYLTAASVGHYATPDIEMYACMIGLKHIAAFEYIMPGLQEIIPALQKHTLSIADFFPFIETPQPNIDNL